MAPDKYEAQWETMYLMTCAQWSFWLASLFLQAVLTMISCFTSLSTSSNPGPADPWICPAFANSVDPDQLASEEANWSESALFVIKYVNLYKQSRSSNLIGWKLEEGMAS